MAQYWISKWLDENSIFSFDEANHALRRPRSFESLLDSAPQHDSSLDGVQQQLPEQSILAGYGFDLSDESACSSTECRLRQVDKLFSRVWHYFDRVVVNDNLPTDIAAYRDSDPKWLRDALRKQLKVLFYLRSLGAEDLVEFRPKPYPCTRHLQRHANEAGIGIAPRWARSIAKDMLQSATFEIIGGHGRGWNCEVKHPDLPVVYKVPIANDQLRGDPAMYSMMHVVRDQIGYLISDIKASSALNVPLASVLNVHQHILQGGPKPTVDDVALRLELPILDGVSVREIIKLRTNEKDSFEAFRTTLRLAIKEKINNSGDEDAIALAAEVQADLVEPALIEIKRRLRATQRAMAKKSAIGLGLGVLLTTCGTILGLNAETAAIAGLGPAIAGLGTAAYKGIEEERDIALSDLYFLWKAHACVPH